MTREDAIKLARYYAFLNKDQHTYIPKTKQEMEKWMPHEWMIQAMLEASRIHDL